MERADFYTFPRIAQDRFVDSCNAVYDPKPLAFAPQIRPVSTAWVLLSLLALAGVVALWVVGHGSLDNPLARHGWPLVVVHGALLGAIALGVFQALAHHRRVSRLPWRPGIYLFPANLIDAREPELVIHSLSGLTEVRPLPPTTLEVWFGRQRFRFPVDAAHLDRAASIVRSAGDDMTPSLSREQLRDRDPLVSLAFAAPLAPTVPLERPANPWLKWRIPAVLLAALLAIPSHLLRDSTSDDKRFAAATAQDDEAAYRSYLAEPGAHEPEVSRVRLPRVALREARADGTVAAIDAFSERFPDHDIAAEVETARKEALLRALAEARAAGTLHALLAYAERYPGHGFDAELAEARHAHYATALKASLAKVPARSEDVKRVLEQLFAFAEKQGVTKEGDDLVGPPIEVRIRRVASKAMKRASELLKRNPYYVGETSLPTGYLDAEHLSPHETRTAAAFAERLRAAFPREIARVTSGETLAADLPSVTTPTLVVSYRLEPSGEAYASKKPRGIYMGLVFFFDIAMLMPPQEQALQSKHVLTTKIPVDVLAAQPFPNAPGAVERALYDAMLEKGFTEMERRYFTQWYE